MAEVKLTKNELRAQQTKLKQLQRYLPTLQLKKALLQAEVQQAKMVLSEVEQKRQDLHEDVEEYARLFPIMDFPSLEQTVQIDQVDKHYENIAGVEIPIFDGVSFHPLKYHLLDSPIWMDAAIDGLHKLIEKNQHLIIERKKVDLLQKELREVSIRVNLFEKILIPRSILNIKKIKVFLGDQQLAAVAQAKVAKMKIEQSKEVACA